MFITLKSSGRRKEGSGGGFEQVAQRQAGGANGRSRPPRRSACVACQKNKLRCTGCPRNCDRCQARALDCVLPATTSRRRPNSSTLTWQCESVEARDETLDGIQPPPESPALRTQGGDLALAKNPTDNDMPAADFLNFDGEGFDADIGDLGLDNSSLDFRMPSSPVADMNVARGIPPESHIFHSEYFRDQSSHPGKSLPGESGENQKQPVVAGHVLQARSDFDVRLDSSEALANSGTCSCLCDAVRVVQQLEDDEFHTSTLSLDMVLQLQKWLIFQCCNVLDCPKCASLPTVHAMVLIICDRMSEMFECISTRIRLAAAVIMSLSPAAGSSSNKPALPENSESPDPSNAPIGTGTAYILTLGQQAAMNWNSTPSNPQLFSNTSGGPAASAACNPLLFSNEFRAQYSDEEQIHIMRVLLKLQIRNFRHLLVRVERAGEAQGSQARRAKVQSMTGRVDKASTSINGTLEIIFQTFLGG
ncbi:hypothetical protein B0T26DRAFT_735421 [Lasiosphaeria miniovina]|uniref:Zn(2)-C6 fungal-type domain-containing protein n=1 Tax=Lasiosphaeria miniovina TaxID=1954250 RepID=A0AA39ZQZ8_9PEZI|nr:uncharacterized protein B0T26DRAFT_735421 [Lasiosphaeria miniovina]KAK0701968.1 hypothetical protein B0T26DRAFT_735421 [Lasiosphaeria miniovina]